MCCSEINSTAKKCPYCRHWQNKVTMALYHPASAVVVILIFFIFMQQFYTNAFGPGKDFNIDKAYIKISDTKMQFGENKCGQSIVILGNIKNDSEIVWKNPHFEIIFYDKNKNLIDTDQDEQYGFILPTNEQIPFKVSVSRQFPEEMYGSFKIRILSAREKGLFL